MRKVYIIGLILVVLFGAANVFRDLKPELLPRFLMAGVGASTKDSLAVVTKANEELQEKIHDLAGELAALKVSSESSSRVYDALLVKFNEQSRELATGQRAFEQQGKNWETESNSYRSQLELATTENALLRKGWNFAKDEIDGLRTVIRAKETLLQSCENETGVLKKTVEELQHDIKWYGPKTHELAEKLGIADVEYATLIAERDKWQGIAMRCMTPSPRAQREYKKRCGPVRP